MKTFKYICMFIAFVMAGLSAIMFWGQGFAAWVWQIVCMIWIIDCFLSHRIIDRNEK